MENKSIKSTQAVRQHNYNSWVLNLIILGTILAIYTAVFLPVGQGAFFGITFLCLIMATAMFYPVFQEGSSSTINTGKVVLAIIIYGTTSMFLYLSGMEIMHWGIPYGEYRQIFHKENGYMWLKTNYEEQKELLAILSLWIPFSFSLLLSFFIGIISFGWKWMTVKKPEEVDVDFFLLNPACAWFPWKRMS